MEGRRLILNNSTVIENGECGYAQGNLWCWFTGYTLQQAATLFLDPSLTSHIVYQYGDMQDAFDGFTNCVSLQVDIDGRVSVCLTKGAQ